MYYTIHYKNNRKTFIKKENITGKKFYKATNFSIDNFISENFLIFIILFEIVFFYKEVNIYSISISFYPSIYHLTSISINIQISKVLLR